MPPKNLKSLPELNLNITENARTIAMYIAMVVRNEIEQFHIEHLTDAQMKKLNPLIRNAIYSALYAVGNYNSQTGAKSFVISHTHMIPNYWEAPELTEHLVELLENEKMAEGIIRFFEKRSKE